MRLRRPARRLVAALLAAPLLLADAPHHHPHHPKHNAVTPSAADAAEARQAALTAERQRDAAAKAASDAASQAAAAAAEERRLAAARVAAANRLRTAEQATATAANRMEDLARQRAEAEQALSARAAAMAPLLPLIERLSLYPVETMLAVPAAPSDALRGVVVLQGIGRTLEHQAEGLREQQAQLDAIAAQIAAETPKLDRAQAAQAERAAELDRELAKARVARRSAEDAAAASARRAAEAAAQAASLRAVVIAVERARKEDEDEANEAAARAERQQQPAAAVADRLHATAAATPTGPGTLAAAVGPAGQLVPPVVGRIATAWGAATDAGPSSGIALLAPPQARVVAPCAGRVMFAAPFRSYGPMLIVDCGGGYYAVLAGLARLDAAVGQRVLSGEPLGVMPAWDPRQPARHRPELYVELRHDGQPIDPAPWLKGKE